MKFHASSLTFSNEDRYSKDAAFHNTENKVELSWHFDRGQYEEKKQYLTYDNNNFVADFGGYLGLLLGHSVLTFYEWLVLIIERLSQAHMTSIQSC